MPSPCKGKSRNPSERAWKAETCLVHYGVPKSLRQGLARQTPVKRILARKSINITWTDVILGERIKIHFFLLCDSLYFCTTAALSSQYFVISTITFFFWKRARRHQCFPGSEGQAGWGLEGAQLRVVTSLPPGTRTPLCARAAVHSASAGKPQHLRR